MAREESSEMRQGIQERLHAMAESAETEEKDGGGVEGEEGTVEEGDLLARAVEAGLRSATRRANAIWLSGGDERKKIERRQLWLIYP
jgi:hypothetical protein